MPPGPVAPGHCRAGTVPPRPGRRHAAAAGGRLQLDSSAVTELQNAAFKDLEGSSEAQDVQGLAQLTPAHHVKPEQAPSLQTERSSVAIASRSRLHQHGFDSYPRRFTRRFVGCPEWGSEQMPHSESRWCFALQIKQDIPRDPHQDCGKTLNCK